jgi:PAS domain S-box-containing protein
MAVPDHQLQIDGSVPEVAPVPGTQTQRAMAHLAAIVESSDDAIVGKTLDGQIQSWNAGAQRLFGWSAAEAIGRPITLIIPAERLGEEKHILDTLKRGERIEHFETTRVTKDGRLIDVSLTVSPIRDASGVVIGASKIARDISARKRNEALLRQHESALQLAHAELQSRMRELVRFNEAAVGRELRVIELKQEVNALREQLGQSERYSLRFEEERRAPMRLQAQGSQRSGESAPLESIVRTEQLFERPARPADDHSLARARDAMIQALAESPQAILQRLAQQTLEALRAGSAGVSLLSDDGERFFWPAIAGQWSAHRGGGTPRSFGPDGDVLERDGPLLFARWERRYPYLAATLPLAEESLLVPIHVAGKAVGTIWAITHEGGGQFDAEDLRRLESLSRFAAAAYQATQHLTLLEQRRAALNLLEDAVQARELVEESNRRLQQAQEEQRESERRKDEFLALLGHELRNPLTSISTASELLLRTVPEERKARLAVDMIKRQTAQLTRLVDDLLDIGRITQGRMQLERKPIELSTVISQALETVEPQLHAKQHDVCVISSTPRPLYVHGDFVRLVQCVVNVLTNAAKYSDPHGKVRIEMRPDGSEAVIEIADNGIGIPPELLPKIFDLFVQNDRTLDRSQGGLGIGLSVVKRLIEMHDGHVSARSAGVGQGSTFEIRLPRIEQAETRRFGPEPFKGPSRRVLVVDDNVDAATSLAMLLNLQGHQAEAVYGARDALERSQSFNPEVALLDIGLPEMDGLSLARRLRAMPQPNGALRLIALTGYAQADDRERALVAGFDDHLTKPVDMHTLERVMAGLAGEPGRDD